MAVHARQQVISAVAAALRGLPTTGDNVFESRTQVLDDSKLPAVQVYGRDERSTWGGMGDNLSRPVERELRLWIVGSVRVALIEPDTKLNDICAEVEAALAASNDLGGLVMDLGLVSTQFEVPSDPADKRAGRVGMTWRCVLTTPAGTPTVFA